MAEQIEKDLTRTDINEVIIRNLLNKGTFFENEKVVEVPKLINGNETIQSLTAEDYCRIMLHNKQADDPRWVRKDQFQPGWSIKTDENTVNLYDGREIVTAVYPATDIEGIDQYRTFQTEEINFDYANDLLDSYFESENIECDRSVPFEDRIRRAMEPIAATLSKNEEEKHFNIEIMVYQMKSECNVATHAFVDKPNDVAEYMQKNPDSIFSAFDAANEYMNVLRNVHANHFARMVDEYKEKLDEPFKDLEIKFIYSEQRLKDFKGKQYEENRVLHGEEAYQFLVVLNRADKEMVDKDCPYYAKTKFSFQYGNYSYGEMRIDLGDMELNNAVTISEAMWRRCSAFHLNMLLNQAEQDAHINYEKNYNSKTIDKADLISDLNHKLEITNAAFDRFAIEESSYLNTHPEIIKINQYQCKTRLYHYQVNKIDEIPYHWAKTSIRKPDEYGISESGFVVEEARPYDGKCRCKPFYTKAERETLRSLNDFSISYKGVYGYEKPIIGKCAMDRLHYHVLDDKLQYEQAVHNGYDSWGNKTTIKIMFQGMDTVHSFQIGKLDFGNQSSLADTLRYIVRPITPTKEAVLKNFEELESLCYKYDTYEKMEGRSKVVTIVSDRINYPYEDKPKKTASNELLANFYMKVAEINGKKDSIPFLVQEMLKDDFKKIEIVNILQAGGMKDVREKVSAAMKNTTKRKIRM